MLLLIKKFTQSKVSVFYWPLILSFQGNEVHVEIVRVITQGTVCVGICVLQVLLSESLCLHAALWVLYHFISSRCGSLTWRPSTFWSVSPPIESPSVTRAAIHSMIATVFGNDGQLNLEMPHQTDPRRSSGVSFHEHVLFSRDTLVIFNRKCSV